MPETPTLSPEHRAKLDGIVSEMEKNNESEADIHAVVDDFKNKYAVKKKEVTNTPSVSPLVTGTSESAPGNSASPGFNYMTGQQAIPTQPVQQAPVIPPVEQPAQPIVQQPPSDIKTGPDGQPVFTGTPKLSTEPQQPLTAAGTSSEITPVDQKNINPDLVKKGLTKGDLTESFMRGTASLASSVAKTPSFLYDVLSTVNNSVNKLVGSPYRSGSSEDLGINKNPISDALDEATKNSRAEFDKKYDKSISEYFSNGEYKKGFDVMANAIAESAPVTISLMAGNAAGLGAGASTAAGGAVFGAQQKSEIDQDPASAGMSNEQKTTTALANGLMEGMFEQFGLTKLGSVVGNVLKTEGKEAALKVAKEGFMTTYGKIGARYLGTGAEESLSEAATQFSQNAIDKYSGLHPDLDLKKGVVDAAIIGLGSSGTIATPIGAMEVAKTASARKKAKELADQKQALEQDIQSPDVSDVAKETISNNIKDINEQEAKIATDEKKKFSALPDDKKQEINSLHDRLNKIEASLQDPNISDNAREVIEKTVEETNKKIDSVFEEAKTKKETTLEDPAPFLTPGNIQPDKRIAKEITTIEPAKLQEVNDHIEHLEEVKKSFGLTPDEEKQLVDYKYQKETASKPVEPIVEKKNSPEKQTKIDDIESKIHDNTKDFHADKKPFVDYKAEDHALKSELDAVQNPTYFQNKVKSENRKMSPEHKAIEKKMAKDLDENYDERKAQYLKEHGNVFDTDRARKLSPEYKENPSLSQAVHVPSREFVTRMYKEELSKPAPEGKKNIVSFTAGGSGVGKSAIIESVKEHIDPQIIVDTNFSHFDHAKSDIDEALASNKKVDINFVYRNPTQAFMEGVVGGKHREGRTVPVDVAINANKGSLETIKQLSEHYKDNENVNITYFNNTGKKGEMKPFQLNDVKKINEDYLKAKEDIQNELEKRYQEGKLTDDQYRGFSGKTELPTRNDNKGISGVGEEQKPVNTNQSTKVKNATTERKIAKSDQQKHQNGDEGGKTTETSNRNSDEQGRKVKEKVSQELIDEEEQADASKKEDAAVLKKMEDDLTVMKEGFKDKTVKEQKELSEKKFNGMIERAWKAKEEDKIKKTSYTEFRNKASDILGGKLNLDKEELKFKTTAIFEKLKTKLLGEGYKKILLSSAGPVTPQTVSDLIDLANNLAHRGIDAGYKGAELFNKVMDALRKHPTYKKLVADKSLNEKEFEKI